MRISSSASFLATALVASGVAIAAPASATTFTGVSQTVYDPDTGEAEQYTVSFTFDASPSPFPVFHFVTSRAPFVPYDYSYYLNITAFSVSGARYDVSYDTGYSQVGTLDPARGADGLSGINVAAGSDGTTIGYSLGFRYLPTTAYATTAMPTSLDISAAFENGFNLTEYYYDGDPADEIIGQREVLNFRFASGGLVAVTAVPETATWGMMILGFGMMGGAMRRRSTKVAVRYA